MKWDNCDECQCGGNMWHDMLAYEPVICNAAVWAMQSVHKKCTQYMRNEKKTTTKENGTKYISTIIHNNLIQLSGIAIYIL